jgi:hypothetical protein
MSDPDPLTDTDPLGAPRDPDTEEPSTDPDDEPDQDPDFNPLDPERLEDPNLLKAEE